MKIDEPVLPIGKFEHADGDYDPEDLDGND